MRAKIIFGNIMPTMTDEQTEHATSDEESDTDPPTSSKKKPQLIIDKSTGLPQIVCDTRKLFEHEGDRLGIFPHGSIRIVINGKSGTGKSHLLRIIIPMMHRPKDQIFVLPGS